MPVYSLVPFPHKLHLPVLKFCIQIVGECAEYNKGQFPTTVASRPDTILERVIQQSKPPHTTDTHPIQIKPFSLLRVRSARYANMQKC